jgi:predicted enzyme related to lactoylglutathione lyase
MSMSTTITRHPENSVSWIDLGTPDLETTAAFYTALFGWVVAPPDLGGYRLCTLRGHLVAALGPAEDPGAPYWTINVTVPDIQAAAARFTDLGARIVVPPTEVGTLGHAAVAIDPVGAPLSLWQPGTHTGMQLAHEQGAFTSVSLLTDHPADAAAFYRQALRWEPGPGPTELRLPDGSTAAIGPPPGKQTVQRSLWLVRFATARRRAPARPHRGSAWPHPGLRADQLHESGAAGGQSRSMTVALAMPPPSQTVCRP